MTPYRFFVQFRQDDKVEKIYVIAGPTASGKTGVAISLAKQIGGEVVSADSMQVYKGMDIGTAKTTISEREGIPHHMIDIVTPDVAFSAALYQQQARKVIADIKARGRVPILCGGTGFYINAVLRDINFLNDTSPYDNYFDKLAITHGFDYLHNLLAQADPAAAESIHPNNVKRVIRALNYNRETGQLFSSYNNAQKKQPDLFQAAFFVLNVERSILYDRINKRVGEMMDAGLVDEVSQLLSQGYHDNLVSMQGIGYKELIKYLNGNYSYENAIDFIQQNTRHYAKRQMTWFKNQNNNTIKINVDGKSVHDIAWEMMQHEL